MFKLLKTFRTVYEIKNFSKAAESLYVSQPAVSSQIKQLEIELECRLFIRNGRQDIEPTREATILYDRLLELSDDWQEVVTAIHKAEFPKETCTIAASNTFAVHYLPQLFAHLTTLAPTIHFVLEMYNSEEVVSKLERHQIDFGFIEKPLFTGAITREKICTDELVVAGNPQSNRWFVREKDSGVYYYTERYLQAENFQPETITVKNNEMIVKLLELGLGQSLISKQALTANIPYQTLGTEYRRSFFFLTRTHLQSAALQAVEEHIRAFYLAAKEQ
jgi:DNA-binding transcriptional LysR family regulator